MLKLPDNILIDCLDALDRGEPIGAILARHPQEADELRPILETAVRLSVMNLQPAAAMQVKSKQAFLTQAEGLKAGIIRPRKRPLWEPLLRSLLRPLLITTLIALFGLGFVAISGNALPGDALYGSKLIIEGAQLSLTGNSANMEERIRQNRVLEVEALLQQNREANVAFSGLIDETLGETWRIEGILVAMAAAELTGNPQVGDFVGVQGLVTNGRLIASSIIVINKDENPPTPTHTPMPTAELTRLPAQEPSSTPVDTPTVAVTSTSTSTAMPTATSTPIVSTETAVAPQALTATPDDDEPDSTEEPDDNNSGSGSSNSGSGSDNDPDDPDDDNSGSGSSNSGSGSGNSGSGSSNSGSGSGSDDDIDD